MSFFGCFGRDGLVERADGSVSMTADARNEGAVDGRGRSNMITIMMREGSRTTQVSHPAFQHASSRLEN